jgi:NAD(P)-dependent dehydrogenase (short-subunit alcohol dehydrogenase family)
MSLKGKVALVTGAGGIRGMGREIALTLAEAGADVAVCDWKSTGDTYDLEGTAQKVRNLGRRSLAVQADVSKEAEVISLFKRVVKEFGTVDILVNNAGVSAHETLFNMTVDLWDRAMDANLKSVFVCCREAAKIMMEQDRGSIISLSSIGGLMWGSSSAYGIAKAGVMVLTSWVARELAPYHVRANAIAPGGVGTDFGKHRIGRAPWEVDPKRVAPVAGREPGVPLGRPVEPADIASLALFLASDASSNITGQVIAVDGGVMLR